LPVENVLDLDVFRKFSFTMRILWRYLYRSSRLLVLLTLQATSHSHLAWQISRRIRSSPLAQWEVVFFGFSAPAKSLAKTARDGVKRKTPVYSPGNVWPLL